MKTHTFYFMLYLLGYQIHSLKLPSIFFFKKKYEFSSFFNVRALYLLCLKEFRRGKNSFNITAR